MKTTQTPETVPFPSPYISSHISRPGISSVGPSKIRCAKPLDACIPSILLSDLHQFLGDSIFKSPRMCAQTWFLFFFLTYQFPKPLGSPWRVITWRMTLQQVWRNSCSGCFPAAPPSLTCLFPPYLSALRALGREEERGERNNMRALPAAVSSL